VSEEPDRERVRGLLAELDKVQRESEQLRAKIAQARGRSAIFYEDRDVPRPFDDEIDPSEKNRS
jgi:hypothetical protein